MLRTNARACGPLFAALAALYAPVGCSVSHPVADAAVIDRGAPDDLSDASKDDVSDAGVAPYDAGPMPACEVTETVRHVVTQDPGATVLELGGLVATTSGHLAAVRQSWDRVEPVDGSAPRRDTVDILALDLGGSASAGFQRAYDSTDARTDLSAPTLLPFRGEAYLLFRESAGVGGASGFSTRVRSGTVTASGATLGPSVLRENLGDPFAAALPDGSIFFVASRVLLTGDAGYIVASPASFRVSTTGALVNPTGVDLTIVVPVTAESALMRSTPTGAAMAFRNRGELEVVRFDATGLVDTRTYVTRGVALSGLDDGALLSEGAVFAWADRAGSTVSVHALVTDPQGRVRYTGVIERFESETVPRVNVTPAWGGAAIAWIRGGNGAPTLRVQVVQPDGALRGLTRDVARVPNADGALVTLTRGREITFVARDSIQRNLGVSFGRACL